MAVAAKWVCLLLRTSTPFWKDTNHVTSRVLFYFETNPNSAPGCRLFFYQRWGSAWLFGQVEAAMQKRAEGLAPSVQFSEFSMLVLDLLEA